jgi:uncharacterized membrane protein YkgB
LTTITGAAIAAGGLLLVGTQDAESGVAVVGLSAAVMGLGFGVHQAAVYALALRGTDRRHAGAASATLAVAQTIGTVLSIAIMTSVLAWKQSDGASFISGYRDVYVLAAIVTVAGGVIALKVPFNRARLPG